MEGIVKETGITTEEASKYIGCSTYTLRDMVRQKKIPHYRVGRKILFTKAGIDEWILEQEKQWERKI